MFFNDGSSTEKIEVEYPIGHRRRRAEGIPVLEQKFLSNCAPAFPKRTASRSWRCVSIRRMLEATAVNEFMEMFVIN